MKPRRMRNEQAAAIDAAVFGGCDDAIDQSIVDWLKARPSVYASVDATTVFALPSFLECFFQHADRIEITNIRLVDSI